MKAQKVMAAGLIAIIGLSLGSAAFYTNCPPRAYPRRITMVNRAWKVVFTMPTNSAASTGQDSLPHH